MLRNFGRHFVSMLFRNETKRNSKRNKKWKRSKFIEMSFEIFRNFRNWSKLIEISIIFRNFEKFRNFDQNWSKFRSISIVFEILTKFRRNWGKNFEKTIEIGQKLIKIWSKLGWKFRKRSKLIEISINFDQYRKISKISKWFLNFYFETKFFDISFRKMGPKRNGPFRSISQHPAKRYLKWVQWRF